MPNPPPVDLAIIGAGPAGCAAAIAAQRGGATTLLIDSGQPAPDAGAAAARDCLGWLSPAALQLCTDLAVAPRRAAWQPFRGMTLRNLELTREARADDPALLGAITDRTMFDAALRAAAVAAGAVLRSAGVRELALGDAAVRLALEDGSTVSAGVVLLTDGPASPAAALARLPSARPATGLTCARATVQTRAAETGLHVVLGGGRAMQLITIVRRGQRAEIALLAREAAAAPAVLLAEFLARAAQARYLEGELTQPPRACVCLAGAALELDTHVGKRCLLAGDAGGFVAALSNEGIYPAMRSGVLAAEAAVRALRSGIVQDEMLSYHAAWRGELADYLRMPSADLALLAPLVFNNAQMATRVARAFLTGAAL